MKIEILKMNKMQETGESLLQLIQNNSLPTLDIFTREVVQNSLDAALPNEKYVQVSFNIGSFSSHEFGCFTPEIHKNILNRFPEECKYLAISDTNTEGLTGPIHDSEVTDYNYGNLLKLVYNISKKQEQDGGGGSWGLGKTVYFRLGIGLVAYYSRIKNEEGTYSSRLAISLIENEKKTETLIDKELNPNYIGVAWWGDHYPGTESACPLVDEKEINEFLRIFNIKPYQNDQTGTIVIIPFVNEELLLQNAKGYYSTKKHSLPWLSSIEEYLSVAVQRWYAPRLNNRNYWERENKSYLKVKINDNLLEYDDTLQIFKIIRALYNEENKFFDDLHCEPVYKDITLNKEFSDSKIAGRVKFIKLDKLALNMYPPENEYNPFLYINTNGEGEGHYGNPPIICFTRKPGMIVNYDVQGPWSYRIGPFDENSFVVALFVPNSPNNFIAPVIVRDKEAVDVEGYLRLIEYGDHTTWQDTSGKNLVKKIQNHIRKYITDEYEEKKETIQIPTSNLVGRQIADLLLPKTGFGKAAHRINKQSDPKKGVKRKADKSGKPQLNVLGSKFIGMGMNIDFDFYSGKENLTACFGLEIDSENGNISATQWEEEISLKFPLYINYLEIHEIRNTRNQILYSEKVKLDNESIMYSKFYFQIIKSSMFGQSYAIKITKPNAKEYYIKGRINVSFSDHNVQGLVKAWEDK